MENTNTKVILVEEDYKSCYGRFALTEEEFKEKYPETYKSFGPIIESNSDTLKPMVHIWFCPTTIGSPKWNNFFTDMEDGLPETDIEADNLAYIDLRECKSLKDDIMPFVTEGKDIIA